MPYLKLTVPIHENQFEELEDILSSAGALSVTMEDAGDTPILEPGVDETPLWQELKLSALFEVNVNQKKLLNKLKNYLSAEIFEQVQLEELADDHWELKWLDYFNPISFGETLWVGTPQHHADKNYQAKLYLEPGLAFGTGSHPSTYLCLEWLATHDLRDKVVIDYGCGSGILAIAAAKLGAREVICVDNDPQALTATQNNAMQNGVTLQTYLPENLPDVKADILIANILANPLVSLAPHFINLLKTPGQLVLAGILISQENFVREAYQPEIAWVESVHKEEWVRLFGIKQQPSPAGREGEYHV